MRKNILFTFALLLMALCSSTKVWADEDNREAYAVIIDRELLRFEYIDMEAQESKLTATPGETHYKRYVKIMEEYGYENLPEWCSENIKRAEFDSSFADYRPKSTAYWFYDCKNMESVDSIENLVTDVVTDMSYMFYHCSSLTRLDLSGLHTFNVTNMHFMFGNCGKLNYLDISDFNTSKVRDMSYMFCSVGLSSIDVSCFDTSQVEDMQLMFKGCTYLKELDLSGFDTKKVKNMNSMFRECSSIDSLYLGSFELTSLTNAAFMFEYCGKLKTIVVSDKWRFNASINSTAMFMLCKSLVGGQGTSYKSDRIDGSYAHIDGGPSNPGYLTEDTNGQFVDDSGQTRAYCVINNNVLSFYYDNKISSRQGLKFPVNKDDGRSGMPEWYYKRMYVNKAVIDPSFAAFQPTSTARWFYNFAAMTTIEGLRNLNTSEVTTMTEMFRFCDKLNNLDLSSFDTSNVTDMSFMVCYCTSLSNLNVSGFNTSNVVDMQHMFHMSPATELDLRSFDTKNVTDMNTMFTSTQLRTIYVSDKWTTERVTHSTYMFAGSTNLVGGMGTKFDPRHTDHEYACIDGGLCAPGYLTGEAQDAEPEPYAVLDDKGTLTFYYDGNKNCRDGKVYVVEKEYSAWYQVGWNSDSSSILAAVFDSSFSSFLPTSTAYWFYNCYKLNTIKNIANLNTSETTNMKEMFSRCFILDKPDLKDLYTGKVKNMERMFHECLGLTSLDLSHFDTKNLENMSGMFSDCRKLTDINFSNFNTSKVKDMSSMFYSCESLEQLDLSGFNTGSVETFSHMFDHCDRLENLDLSSFHTYKAINMEAMFSNCQILNEISIINFNTNHVENMKSMFNQCKHIETIDMSSFNTQNVTNMDGFFYGAHSLRTIYVSNLWNNRYVVSSSLMFDYCTSLVGGAGTTYDPSYTDYTYAHVDGGPSNPGYFTYKEYNVATSIEEMPSESMNAQDETWYNLQGIRVDNPAKGIYIVNGKKVVRK